MAFSTQLEFLDHLPNIVKHQHAQQALYRNQGFVFGYHVVSVRPNLVVQSGRDEHSLKWGFMTGKDV